MQQIMCVQCKTMFPVEQCIYYFDEKFYIKGSTNQLPLCSCECGTTYYNDNGYNKKDVLKNVKQ